MIWYVFLFVALYCSVVTFDIYNQEQHIYVKWLHVDKNLCASACLQYPKYNIEKKT